MKGEEAVEDLKDKFAINVVITMREKDTKLKNKMTEIGNIYVPSIGCTYPYLEMYIPLYSYRYIVIPLYSYLYSACRKT